MWRTRLGWVDSSGNVDDGYMLLLLSFLWVIDNSRDHTVSNLTTATTATSYFIKMEK